MNVFGKMIIALLLVCAFCAVGARAQSDTGEARSERMRRQQEEVQRQRQEQERRMEDADRAGRAALRSGIYSGRRRSQSKISEAERAKIKAARAPAAEDAAKYKDFLRRKNTGLFRLFSDLDCPAKDLIRVGDCADIVPDSWNYSFRQENYADTDFSDITLKNNRLTSAGFLVQGVLTRLGDVPLETVTTESGGIKFLSSFAPATDLKAAERQQAQIANGIEADGYKYARSLDAAENTTYALRVVA